MNNLFVKYSLHVIAWAMVLVLPYLLSFKKAVQFDELWTQPHQMQNLLSWILLIGFSYANHLWLVPKLFLTRKYFLYFTILVFCLLGIIFLPEVTNIFEHSPPPLPPNMSEGFPPKPPMVLENSHIFLLFVLSVLVSINYQTQLRLRETEQQRLQAELEHLKGQIQPHFLFNTLNSIYALAIRKDDKTADTVVQLAEFLRYVIRDADHHLIELEKEIGYLKNYIDLQKSRLRDSVVINFKVEGKTEGLMVVPLILFSFIENAFKHGVSPEEESQINIEIKIQENKVLLTVGNKKVTVVQHEPDAGIGLKNARKRLKLLYPDRHLLNIVETDSNFLVELTILT